MKADRGMRAPQQRRCFSHASVDLFDVRSREADARAARTLLSATLTVVSVGFLALLAAALVTGFYPTRSVTHLGNARVIQEHGTLVSLLPRCGASWVQPVRMSRIRARS